MGVFNCYVLYLMGEREEIDQNVKVCEKMDWWGPVNANVCIELFQ